MSSNNSRIIHNCARSARNWRLAPLFALIVCCVAAWSTGAGAATTAPAPLVLAAADIDLYLQVMRATVRRLRHPTAEDRAALERADAAQQRQRKAYVEFSGSHADGAAPSPEQIAALHASDPDPAERAAIALTAMLRRQPDTLVARELGLDERRYGRVRDVVERLVPDAGEDDDEDAEHAGVPAGQPPPRQPTAQELLALQTDARNSAALQPHLGEIRKLLRQLGRKREVE